MHPLCHRSIAVAAALLASSQLGLLSAQVTADNLKDMSNPSNKIEASSAPVLGKLYPLSTNFNVASSGTVGIGMPATTSRLSVAAQANQIRIRDLNSNGTTTKDWILNADNGQFRVSDESADNRLVIAGNGNVGVGTMNPESRLHVVGTATVGVLRVTGGADVVESLNATEEGCVPGSVVALDAENPGRVRLSGGEYDSAVIGVVSGAGGVHPGLQLGQEGVLEGDVPVAVCGRVYVRCSAENGPIAPGDLLTAGSAPGTAMKATDACRAFGAVIGKAVTSLAEGDGLVLVWITLG